MQLEDLNIKGLSNKIPNMEPLWHSMGKEEALRVLSSDPLNGLSGKEAGERLARYGANELTAEGRRSAYALLIRQFKDPLIIILLVATLLSALLGETFDAILIFLILLFSAALGFVQEHKAERAIEALRKMLSPVIRVIRDGREKSLPVKELVPGDVLLIEAGDKVPADSRLIESFSLKVDEAPLTGESIPVDKITGPVHEEAAVPDRENMLFTGTTVVYGRGRGLVVATGMATEFGIIAKEVTAVRAEKTPLEKRTGEIGRYLGIIALVICFAVGGVGIARQAAEAVVTTEFVLKVLLFAVALAVAAVPEALAAIVTGTLAIGMHEMAKRNALIRRMPAVETLGSVTVICSDKTGTVTKGEMTVRKIYTGAELVDVTGVGYEPKGELSLPDAAKKLDFFFKACVLCNDSSLIKEKDRWTIKGDPTEAALLVLAVKAGMDLKKIKMENPRLNEVPFSSERKLMTTVNRSVKGEKMALFSFMKGAPEVLIGLSLLDEERKKEILETASGMARSGLRVLALAGKELHDDSEELEGGMTFYGIVGMMDPPREEAIEAVRVCSNIGIRPVMITGDHKLTAVAVAKEVGIYKEGDIALTGEELERLSDGEFEKEVRRVSVYARVSPVDKLRIVKAWKKHGEVVAMTGDGVNDAPALKHADIGIAMGITGTEVTKEASDMVLTDDNFATILKAIERGRWVYDNIKKYLTYLLRANLVEVLVLGGVVIMKGPDYLPLLPPAILFINLVTDGLPALALGVAPPESDIMTRPPRDPKESVFSFDVRAFILLALLIEGPLFFWVFLGNPDTFAARTDLFYLFIIVELAIALNFRSLRYSIFTEPPHILLVLAVLGSLALTFLIVFLPEVREAFGVQLPHVKDLDKVLLIVAGLTLSLELTKAYLRKKFRARVS